jgi:para-aminobenzoate synthetase component 1
LGRYLENLPVVGERDIDFPEMQVGIYLWALVVDHKNKRIELIAAPTLDSAYIEQILKRLTKGPEAPINHPFSLNAPFKSNMNSASYSERFSRIIDYIKAGDCYQVNLAQRFSAPCQGDSWEAYQALRIKAPTPFSAYLTTPFGNLLCLSPERFIQVKNGRVETKPIKGTRPRGDSAENDETLRIELLQSTKDRAENLMIVDLLRNDLGKTCAIGSVKVPKLFDIESYANVHHMVTTITGELKNTEDAVDLLEGSFPGGSITGAPKLRAMEIIEELEPQRRSAYCGSIGYIDFSGRMDTNICIRTLVEKDQQLHCWAGGGIVADSQCADEYQETFTKVNNLIRTLEDQFGHSQ